MKWLVHVYNALYYNYSYNALYKITTRPTASQSTRVVRPERRSMHTDTRAWLTNCSNNSDNVCTSVQTRTHTLQVSQIHVVAVVKTVSHCGSRNVNPRNLSASIVNPIVSRCVIRAAVRSSTATEKTRDALGRLRHVLLKKNPRAKMRIGVVYENTRPDPHWQLKTFLFQNSFP